MKKRIAVLALLVLCALPALAQQAEPPNYIWVAEWNVPRARWDEVSAGFEKNTRPILDRLMAAGTITGWGWFSVSVHSAEGASHGIWFMTSSVGANQKAFEELVKAPTAPALTESKHWDIFLRSIFFKSRTVAAPASGYLWVNSTRVQPGKGQDWRELWEKYNKPVFDELLANGTITAYSVDSEFVHTDDPGNRYVVYVTPTADGVDKVIAAQQAVGQKRTAEERRAIGDAFAAVVVPGTHRDFFARVVSYAHK